MIEWLMTPQNSVAIVLFIVALFLFRDLRYTFWKATMLAASFASLIYAVAYVAR